LSRVADDLRLGLDESGVADSQTVEEVHEDDDDQEDERQEEQVRHRAQTVCNKETISFRGVVLEI